VTGTDNGTFHNFPFRQWLVSVCVGVLQQKHFAAFAALQFFGSYRTNNGHHRTLSPSWLGSD